MKRERYLHDDALNSAMVRARQERSEHLAQLVKNGGRRLHRAMTRPDAEHRKLAKVVIKPVMAGHRHNRSTVNPLILRGLAIS